MSLLPQTYRFLLDRIEYVKQTDGSWTAEFHGFTNLSVAGPSLEKCRFKIVDEIDERLVAFLATQWTGSSCDPPEGASGQ